MSVRAADEGTAISSRPGRALRAQVPRLGGRLKRQAPACAGGPRPAAMTWEQPAARAAVPSTPAARRAVIPFGKSLLHLVFNHWISLYLSYVVY